MGQEQQKRNKTMAGRRNVYELTDGKCFYCGCKLDYNTFHCDHFYPKSRGGKRTDNLVPACQDCNLFKSDMSLEEFRQAIETLPEKTIKGRMQHKYLGIKHKTVKFYFEKVLEKD